MSTEDTLRDRLSKRFQPDQIAELAGQAVRPMLGRPGDWDPPDNIQPKRDMLSLSIGVPDPAVLPRQRIFDSMQRVQAANDDGALRYGSGTAPATLRSFLAQRFSAEAAVDEDWFEICNGSAGAIDLVVRTLIEPGDVIVVEAPTFMASLRNFRGVQADIVPVPVDDDGLCVDALAEVLRTHGNRVKLIYTIDVFQNPTGVTLSMPRRLQLLELAGQWGFLILEDAVYGELYFDTPPPPRLSALADGYAVITVGSFSKTVATGLRVGWVHARPELINMFRKMKFGMGANGMSLSMMCHFLEDDFLDGHIDQSRQIYKRKMAAVADVLEALASRYVDFVRPAGGFYLWVGLTEGIDAKALWRTAAEEGVHVNHGAHFFPDRVDPGEHIRIAYAGAPESTLAEAAQRIAAACERVARGDIA